MSDRMRWRYGDTNPVVAAVDAETVIEIGDLVFQDGANAKPAEMAAALESFAASFLGVAMQRSRAGETAPIRVATTGVFEFECYPDTFELGQLVAPTKTPLANQIVAKCSGSDIAIGRVARRQATASQAVHVDIVSTVMRGGVAGTTRPQVNR